MTDSTVVLTTETPDQQRRSQRFTRLSMYCFAVCIVCAITGVVVRAANPSFAPLMLASGISWVLCIVLWLISGNSTWRRAIAWVLIVLAALGVLGGLASLGLHARGS